jgi:hypothetical protein
MTLEIDEHSSLKDELLDPAQSNIVALPREDRRAGVIQGLQDETVSFA